MNRKVYKAIVPLLHMKLSQYAKELGITYRTAWNWFRAGRIKGAYKTDTGIILVPLNKEKDREEYTVIYTRVSSSENKNNLESQSKRLKQYAIAKGYKIDRIIKEVGSGINDNRQKLNKILNDGRVTRILVEHKDRLTRFGFRHIRLLLERHGCEIEVINEAEEDKEDLMQDLISIITSFCAKYYGLRRSRRKTEKIIKELELKNERKS